MELVASRQPDVLVTEVVLPELDGFALLRGSRSCPPAQVVVVSAFCSQRTVREGGGAGRSLLPAQALQRAVPARAHPGRRYTR